MKSLVWRFQILKYGIALLFLLAGIEKSFAAEEERRWEVGIVGGVYKPSLKTLNRILNERSSAILQDPNHQLQPNEAFTPEVRNPEVPSFEADRAFGIELMREANRRHAFVATLNIWDAETIKSDIVPQITTAVATDFKDVPRTSRYNVSITNLWLGWRYHFPIIEKKSRVFIDIGLIGLAYGQMTIDTLLKVIDPDPNARSFAITSSLEAAGWGLTSRWGVGGTYFLKNWIAVSFQTGYIVGEIPRLKVRRFFPAGFRPDPPPESQTGCQPGQPDLQPRPREGEVVTYGDVQRGNTPTCEIRSNVKKLPLELDGVEGMIGIHFYF